MWLSSPEIPLGDETLIDVEKFISDKDITVYVRLEKKDLADFVICLRKVTAEFHKEIRLEDRELVYAFTQASEDCFKAIIPRGSQFWLGDDLGEVASERLYVTAEKAKEGERTDFSSLYRSGCLDLLLKNGKRTRWSPEISFDEVKGIYVYGSQAIGLRVFDCNYLSRQPLGLKEIHYKAKKDQGGEKNTDFMRKNHPYLDILKNIPDDSYLPSGGEILKAFKEITRINLTRQALGLRILGISDMFWTSTYYGRNGDFWFYKDHCLYTFSFVQMKSCLLFLRRSPKRWWFW